jgi:serine/threonine protein kinase
MKKKAVQREIAVLKKLDHPNVIKMHEMIETPR